MFIGDHLLVAKKFILVFSRPKYYTTVLLELRFCAIRVYYNVLRSDLMTFYVSIYDVLRVLGSRKFICFDCYALKKNLILGFPT